MRTTKILSLALPLERLRDGETLGTREGRTKSERRRDALRRDIQEQEWRSLQRAGDPARGAPLGAVPGSFIAATSSETCGDVRVRLATAKSGCAGGNLGVPGVRSSRRKPASLRGERAGKSWFLWNLSTVPPCSPRSSRRLRPCASRRFKTPRSRTRVTAARSSSVRIDHRRGVTAPVATSCRSSCGARRRRCAGGTVRWFWPGERTMTDR